MRIGVIADDLTGAFDTGVQFRNWGLSVEVIIGNTDDAKITSDVIVVDTNSRHMDKENAYQRVYHSTEKLMKLGVDRIYKKIDSTLRGNIGAELDAVMDALHANYAIFAPAYPTYGRLTLDGKQLVDNNPIDNTEYMDELCVKSSEIAKIIGAQSKRRIGLVDHKIVEAGADSIVNKIKALKKEKVEVAIFDVLTERNLIDIAYSIGDVKLLVGSAGFASEVPLGLRIKKIKPILSICGSVRSLSRVQTRNLRDRLGFREVEIMVRELIDGDAAMNTEVKRCISDAVEAFKVGIDVSLITSPKDYPVDRFIAYSKEHGMEEEDAKFLVEKAIGMVTSAIITETEVSALVLTGGATTLMVCKELGLDRAHIVEEIEPGIPLLMFSNGMLAVTKAGGFGSEFSLVRAAQRLRRVTSK